MTSMNKQYMFQDLLDGQVFKHGGKRWIKVAESGDYNAVSFHNSNLSCDFGLSCIVEIEQSLEPEECDLIDDEEVLRSIEGYKENF